LILLGFERSSRGRGSSRRIGKRLVVAFLRWKVEILFGIGRLVLGVRAPELYSSFVENDKGVEAAMSKASAGRVVSYMLYG